MVVMNKDLALPVEDIIAFCKRHPIRKLSLFGSAQRDDFTPESDVDLLVEFEPGAPITYLDMAGMEIELTRIIGRKVDLRTPQELSPYFRDKVMRAAELLYEQTQ
jgi:predicted nucleotidyltransferase